ncbi:MAG: UTP--glucose-phosphate uridylyltransferase [Solirubrobacteraceae bacterium]|nr:UTP--glucose-phosphate uridylyltransferase [Solirubrobacteraceae bacterium]
MRRAGEPDAAVAGFRHRYRQLAAGDDGAIRESEIDPLEEPTSLEDLPVDQASRAPALDRLAVIKINGGLGTSMGLSRAKGIVVVKDGLSFLDIVARQVLAARRRHRARLPLVLMNSARTREDSLAVLDGYPDLPADLPLDFLQGLEPKLRADDLRPVSWPADPALEWCPAGHGDLFVSLLASGLLEQMLDRGYEYAFISNTDNLGAVADPRVLAWMEAEQLDFVSEQCDRTPADRKGGHLARSRRDRRLLLRETAQTAAEDQAAMQDITRHRYFHANNIWLRLPALADLLAAGDGVLSLPLIRNEKTVDPTDPSSPAVYQLESAVGSAIALFERAGALRSPRGRFVPVKTTDDLLTLRSDCFTLDDDARLQISSRRRLADPPYVELDPDHYKLLDHFEARFPSGAPSLAECERLVVRGEVTFGAEVTVRGSVEIDNAGPAPLRIADGSLLTGAG